MAVVATPVEARLRKGAGRYFVLLLLALLAVLMVVPFVIVAMNAVKSSADYTEQGPLGLPSGIDLEGLKAFWTNQNFGRKLINSAVISGSVSLLAVVLSLFNAFALGVGRVKGRFALLVAFILAATVPQESIAYPLYYLAKKFNLYDTRLSVIIIFTVLQTAFGTYLLSSVLAAFPREVLEAARIDGAGPWQVLWRIIVPISRPTLVVMMVFFFIWTWNEFFLPLVFLVSNDNQTVPLAVATLQGQRLTDVTGLSSAALLGVLPAVIFFLIFQRTLTRGITMGAVK